MKKRIILALIITLMIALTSACASQNKHLNSPSSVDAKVNETKNKENTKLEISMEDAILIGLTEAKNHYDNLKLTEIHSYDNDYSPDENAGDDGKREWWYVSFANEKVNYVSILVADGEIVEVDASDENGNNGLFNSSDIKLTSKEAAQKAIEKGMRGGNPDNEEEWVSGFNFKLEFGSLAEAPDNRILFLDVIGISLNGNFARISFDATNGELLLAMEKFEYENGDVEWKPF